MTGAGGAQTIRSGVVLVLGAAAGLATLGTVSTLAYRTGITPQAFTALRAVLGAAILAVLVARGLRPSVRLRDVPQGQQAMLLAAIVSNATMNLALFLAFGAMTIPLVMAVYYTYPVLVAVAAIALGLERARPSRIAALALATAGLVLVLSVEIGPDASVSAPGIALAFVAAACQATYFLVSRRGYDAVPPEQATSLILAGGAVLSGLMALTVGGGIGDAGWLRSPEAWLAILWAGTVGAAVAKVMLLVGIRRIGSTRAAVVMLAEPVIGVVLAVVVLAQPLAPQQVVGGIAILVAAWIVQRPNGRSVPDTAPAPVAVASD